MSAKRECQVIGLDDVPQREDCRPLDDVLQLTDVSGPVIVREHFKCPWIDLLRFLGGHSVLEKEIHEQRNVFLSLAKVWDLERNDIDAIEKVFPESSRGNLAAQILVCR